MKVMAGGGNWPNPETRRSYDGNTIARAALKWVLNHEGVTTAIPGFNNYEHMELDWGVASSLAYTEKESSFLGDNAVKLGMGFCRQCRKCLATCPHGVDVPTMMRTHMYAAQYGNFHLARQALEEVPASQTVRNCISCGSCSATCANSVDIARRIEELKLIYT
jgi:predicted aldo/keto reductase-like oxidoreductase